MNKTFTRTVCVKLDAAAHDTVLTATMKAFNAAASWIAQMCWDEGITNTNTAHHRVYGETRTRFALSAQLAVNARAKAVEAIKSVKAKKRETCPVFGPRGSVRYDARSYGFKPLAQVSLLTLAGRVVCRMVMGARQHTMLTDPAWDIGSADLVWRRGGYFLHVTQSREAPEMPEPDGGALGVDLGIVNLATDSDGQSFSGAQVKAVRKRYHTRRQRLQQVGTKSAKRRLKRNAGRESRFQKDTNHCISKALVGKAARTCKALVLEDLTGIRDRITVRHDQRYQHHSWAFFQLRTFLTYKAAWAGVPVYLIDPRNTSRTCSACGHCEKANRTSQAEFSCKTCGFALNADHNAAINIAGTYWAAVKQPMAVSLSHGVARITASPSA